MFSRPAACEVPFLLALVVRRTVLILGCLQFYNTLVLTHEHPLVCQKIAFNHGHTPCFRANLEQMLGAGVLATDPLGVFVPRAITLPTPSELGFGLCLLWFIENSHIQVASVGHLPIDLLAVSRALPQLRHARVRGYFPGLLASPRQKTSPSGTAWPPEFNVETNCVPGTSASRQVHGSPPSSTLPAQSRAESRVLKGHDFSRAKCGRKNRGL